MTEAASDLVTVVAIYIAPATRLPMRSVQTVRAKTGGGLEGDRYENAKHRHVSIFSTGELAEASEIYGQIIDPSLTRRNVLLETGALNRTPGHLLTVGDTELQVVRDAAPCRILDDAIGDGSRSAMRRRAGVICRVLKGGSISIGDIADLGEPPA